MSRAIVIGGGFYGASIALYLKRSRRVPDVVLLERAPHLLTRSSFTNQARVHSGMHYPRSGTTARRSAVNAPRFEADYGASVFRDFTKLYAVPRTGSLVTPRQMERFGIEIGADIAAAPPALAALFDPARIAATYVVTEHVFDADHLRTTMIDRLAESGVDVQTGCDVTAVESSATGVRLRYELDGQSGEITADVAFNCTYSRIQHLLGNAPPLAVRHEISEMILVEPPAALSEIGVTVMDGPFFSLMPFPARGLHSLSHVRYTPHMAWQEDGEIDPYAKLAAHHCESRADRMIRDAARYLPAMRFAKPHSSMFEVKTVPTDRDHDDGRPILFHRDEQHGRLLSILGGKIDNIYDALERLDAEPLPV